MQNLLNRTKMKNFKMGHLSIKRLHHGKPDTVRFFAPSHCVSPIHRTSSSREGVRTRTNASGRLRTSTVGYGRHELLNATIPKPSPDFSLFLSSRTERVGAHMGVRPSNIDGESFM
jgi:hypothetical protein